jgi:hypothetical protein
MSDDAAAPSTRELEKWRLPYKTVQTTFWDITAAYASPTACAVVLKEKRLPSAESEGDPVNECRRLIRLFRMLAYQRGHVRPVVAIACCSGELLERLSRLAGDADWDEGKFVLFVVDPTKSAETSLKDPSEALLLDLLEPVPRAAPPDLFAPLSFQEAASEPSAPRSNMLFERLRTCTDDNNESAETLDRSIEKWLSDTIATARSLTDLCKDMATKLQKDIAP